MQPRADAARRLRPVFLGAVALLVLLLAVFAYALAKSQNQQRHDLEKRFSDRADVAASVNESIFTLATQQTKLTYAQQFGGPKVDSAALAAFAAQSRAPYAEIVAADGKVVASAGKPATDPGRSALIARALKSKIAEYSSLFTGPGGMQFLDSATAFPTKSGLRVALTSVRADLISGFLNGFLTKLPNVSNARSYVVDPQAKVIATPGRKSKPGEPIPEKGLAQAVLVHPRGSYDGGRYFASAPISGTPWRIVLSAAKGDLYSSVKTTVSWLIFAAFVLVSALGLFLVRRVLLANAELERADLSRQHALEINDNVVQRLVLAKYALDRGATETSQQKLAETLRETQQLVTSLLEEKEIAPGALRREGPAGTEGPPAPPAPSGQRNR